MKTRKQKEKDVKEIVESLKSNDGFILAGFSGISVDSLSLLRREVRQSGGSFRVLRKRLLKIALKQTGTECSFEDYNGQTAFVPFSGSLPDVAGAIHRFSVNEKNKVVFLGGFDIKNKKILSADFVRRIGALPPREILLGHVVGTIIAPLRGLMYLLSIKAKQS